MAGKLRKLAPDDMYRVTGTLDGLSGPGRRTVRKLQVVGLQPGASLQPLRLFPDLHELELSRARGVDLSVLDDLPVTVLNLDQVVDADLSFLAGMQHLEVLQLVNVSECEVPARLPLPPSLRAVSVIVEKPAVKTDTTQAFLKAVVWPRLTRLVSLGVHVDYADPLIELDLSFLAQLPALRELNVLGAVRHSGSGPSPLEPPFDGLPKEFERLRFEAREPERVLRAAERYFGAPQAQLGYPIVYQRYAPKQAPTAWEIAFYEDEPERPWGVRGSLADAQPGPERETEHAALQVARRRLQETDPALLGRLDFDQEADSTGIFAPTREDLEATLRILGLG